MSYHFEAVGTLKYATEKNAPIYRSIMRFLLEQHENLKHYSQIGEIFAFLKNNGVIPGNYHEEDLYADMKQLEEWEAVLSRQDRQSGFTIEEFKKKRLRFQITPLAIEIEMTLRRADELEEALVGSLESKDFERILKTLVDFEAVSARETTNEVIQEIWISLMNLHDKLKRNASSYLAHLRSEKAEELFKTEEFLVYKEKFVDYLHKFIRAMNLSRYRIAAKIRMIDDGFVSAYIDRLVEYHASIPMIDGTKFNADKNRKRLWDNWRAFCSWFNTTNGDESDVSNLLVETEKSIQLLSRYALQLSEMRRRTRSRKEDFRALARWFQACESLDEAHVLYASAFGAAQTRHIVGRKKLTDSTEEEIWEQDEIIFETTPHNRIYKRRKTKSFVSASREEEMKRAEIILEERRREAAIMESYIVSDVLAVKEMGVIDPFVRKTLLEWVGKAMTNRQRRGQTDQGKRYSLHQQSQDKIELVCTDGILRLPDLVLKFEER